MIILDKTYDVMPWLDFNQIESRPVRLYGMHQLKETVNCFGGGDTTTTDSTIRFAPYVEENHSVFLDLAAYHRAELIGSSGSVLSKTEWFSQIKGLSTGGAIFYAIASGDLAEAEYAEYVAAQEAVGEKASPFAKYDNIDVDNAFFGSGYLISSFPSLYDMYGKFMAGLDVEALYSQSLETATESPLINDLVTAESTLLDDDIEANILPRFELGARDINSVMSSSFVIGKSVIEEARVKSIAKFSAQLKYNMIPISVDLWKTHLTWNQNMITAYLNVMKTFFEVKPKIDGINYGMSEKDTLWPFTVLALEGDALGALTGTSSGSETTTEGSSTLSTVLGVASALLGFF